MMRPATRTASAANGGLPLWNSEGRSEMFWILIGCLFVLMVVSGSWIVFGILVALILAKAALG